MTRLVGDWADAPGGHLAELTPEETVTLLHSLAVALAPPRPEPGPLPQAATLRLTPEQTRAIATWLWQAGKWVGGAALSTEEMAAEVAAERRRRAGR